MRASRDELTRAAVERSTSFARRALRARSAFFWSFANERAVLLSSAGDTDRQDVVALGSAFGRGVLEAVGPVARSIGREICDEGWLGVVVRAAGGEAQGVLMVADPAPRAFDAADLDLIDEVGANLAREMDRAAEVAVGLPLRALVDLSDSVLRDATSADSVTADQCLAAADSLASAAARLRQLARQGAATTPAAATSTPERGDLNTAGARGARILIADDLDLNRKLIADMLSIEGHEVVCVADGAAAVRAVQAATYDLVLMDMIMPEMDGIAATRAIRALPAPACHVPIVALTANSFREQLASCLEAGMDATLTKPMSIDALTQAVAAWTRGRHEAA